MIVAQVLTFIFVVAVSCYHAEAGQTKPITEKEFKADYDNYIKWVEKCHAHQSTKDRDACLKKVQGDFRPTVRRAINSNVIGEIKCHQGEFGTFDMVRDGSNIEVKLPC